MYVWHKWMSTCSYLIYVRNSNESFLPTLLPKRQQDGFFFQSSRDTGILIINHRGLALSSINVSIVKFQFHTELSIGNCQCYRYRLPPIGGLTSLLDREASSLLLFVASHLSGKWFLQEFRVTTKPLYNSF